MIAWEEKTAPSSGRASLWGTPYSGTPIWFSDLKLTAIGKEPAASGKAAGLEDADRLKAAQSSGQ
jgi:hypothetical protein